MHNIIGQRSISYKYALFSLERTLFSSCQKMSKKCVSKNTFYSPPRPRYARAQLRETIYNIHLKVRPSAKRPMSRRPCCRRRRGVVTQRPARTKFSGTNFSFGEGKWSVKNLWPSGCWFCYCLSMWESLRSLLCHPI